MAINSFPLNKAEHTTQQQKWKACFAAVTSRSILQYSFTADMTIE